MSAPHSARACDAIVAVAYVGSEEGSLTIRVNDVTLLRDLSNGMANFVPPSLLLEGENTLTLELAAKDGGAPTARAEVFKGCMGEFPQEPGQNANVLASAALDAPGSQTTSFTISGLPAYSYLSAEPSDDAGLLDAIAGLIEMVRQKDVEGYLGYLQPMLHDFALDDPQAPEMLREMAGYLVEGPFEVVDPGALTVTPVLGGRAYQVQDAAGNQPLQFRMPAEGSEAPEELSQAGLWMKTDAGWKVLRH